MESPSPDPQGASRTPPVLAGIGIAVLCTGVALAARLALDAVAPETLPFATFFPAILIATLLQGWLAGSLTLLAGTVLIWYLVLPPRYSFSIESSGLAVSLVLFAATAGLMVAIADRFRRQNERLRKEAAARADVEAALSRTAAELETVLSTVPVAVWFTYGSKVSEVRRNRFAAEMMRVPVSSTASFGDTPNRLEGLEIRRAGERLASDALPLQRALRGESSTDEELQFAFADGTTRTVLSNARPLLGPGGTIVGAVSMSLDITDRKRIEEALQASETRLSRILQTSPVAIIETDAEGRIAYANPAAERILRLSRSAITDRAYDTPAWGVSGPDGEPLATEDLPGARALRGETVRGFEHAVQDPATGERIVISVDAVPLPDALGGVRGVLACFVDVTARHEAERALRESEGQFRAITDSIDQMIWSTRPDGFHDFYNRRWYEYTGVPEGSTDGAEWNGMFHPEDQDRAWAVWRHSLETGEPYHIEYRLRHRSGAYRWVLGRAQPVRDDEGRITRWFGTCTDIQDIVEAREVLARSREDLERLVEERTQALADSNRRLLAEIEEREKAEERLRQAQKMEAVGQLTGGIAHDFNNLLAVITGSLQLLRRRLDKGEVAAVNRHLDAAMDGAQRAATLTHRLLAFSRQQPLAPEPVDANKLVAGMSELLRRTLGEDVRLETVLAGGLWRTHADANQLENAVLNLAVNGRDAMRVEDGTGVRRLTIETANCDLDERYARDNPGALPGQYVMIAVTDTGAGMPADVMERAFDPFFTTKPTGQGTGLGLSQVYGFVRQSGGHIKIYSELGQGTTVKVYLPRFFGTAEETQPVVREGDPLPASRDGELILVVEDEDSVRRMSVESLRELGYRVVDAENAMAALRLIDAEPGIRVLFTDIVMPEVNGRRLADEALRRRPDLKVLFTTGYTKNAIVHNGVLDPGVDLISKPFTLEQLATKMKAVLARE